MIARPPFEVFAYVDDVSRELEWQPTLRVAGQEPPGPTQIGSRKRYESWFLGRNIENTYVVTEFEPGRRIVCETEKGSAVDARTEVVCEAAGTGTRITMSIDGKPRGALRFVPAKVLEATYRAELDGALARLKERMEGAP